MAGADSKGSKGGSAMSDLLVRFVSAVAMLGVAFIALWLGGWFWVGFVALLAGLVLWEWNLLVKGFNISPVAEVAWQFVGALYVGAAALAMVQVRINYDIWTVALAFLAPVIAVDVGAYFAGRLIGGPKIAPSISPSKTWAGLLGGALAAGIFTVGIEISDLVATTAPGYTIGAIGFAALSALLIAVIAQAGDFFESWMKRRAGAKDSSSLIPGHGGIFDRLDGFIAVYFVLFLVAVVPSYIGLQ
ncbi:phosphatidate cytidylyltransferase [Erythrobacter sp. NAP1]|uniref:phosphatidate cytidylyltransferase n=1 Tax=Erythrobacter sp. NAP1 TaxID=237727 RepID=UPI0000686EDE|nr:phosphatidate cytidylyltransferase [Erythrobacter sp. NAP1]EAQ29665.1 phosphatidate cytidylyltransferase [Erythrobacter sp. NAP1]